MESSSESRISRPVRWRKTSSRVGSRTLTDASGWLKVFTNSGRNSAPWVTLKLTVPSRTAASVP